MADQVVVWSPEALEDVDDIATYIARDSTFYAAAVVEKLLMAASKLNQFPQSGRIVPELNQPDIRERFVYSYRLIYQIEPTRVLVTAVVHGRRRQDDTTASRLAG
ncbi:MAG: plasmid stabilization protein [Hydrogenophilales bacterium 28-61-11]|nr:MAG: plasmid stabilization protein [Hydrogenophilales bacterium 28-61-11]